MSKRKRKTMPVQQVNNAIQLSTNQLLRAGALVLASRWDFTDAETAEWITLTAELANDNITKLAGVIQGVVDRVET